MSSLNYLIKKLDKQNMRGSIEMLYMQCQQAYEETKEIKISEDYKKVKNIVVSGMGGSALGARIIKTVFSDQLFLPLEIINDYRLPKYVDQNTLLLISGYSGNTEEPLHILKEGKKRKAKILVITGGGELKKIAEKENIPRYTFNPKYNPCGEPRMGLGYSLFSQIVFFEKCGLLKIKEREIKEIIDYLKKLNKSFDVKNKNNSAKKIALSCYQKVPVLIASEFLMGNIHAFRNQLNENAKNFSIYFPLPELNHHLMEGLAYPKSNKKNLQFIFFNSSLYYSKNKKRFKITQKVIAKNGIKFLEYNLKGKTKILQSFEMLLLGSYASFYLALLYKLDPSPVPWVNYFKKELAML